MTIKKTRGRPAMLESERRKSITVRLPPHVIGKLEKAKRDKGRVIEKALIAYWEDS